MPIRPRPAKARGNQNFADEVAAGKPDILDVEVDLDFNTLYTLVNGQLTTTNIDPAAGILSSQLHHPLGLTSDDFIAGGLDAGSAAIKDQSITAKKIGVGQTTIGLGHFVDETGFNVGTAEQLLAEVVMVPVRSGEALRGGYFLAMGRISGQLTGNVVEDVTITVNLKMDGNPGDISGTLLERSISQVQFNASPGLSWGIPFNVTLIAPRVLSTTGRFKLTGQTTVPQATGFGFTVHTRSIHGWELA